MTGSTQHIMVNVLAFGPLSERLGGREHAYELPDGTTVRELIDQVELSEWISFGLAVAINGERCDVDTTLSNGDEVALLPPVSGG
ncbi:MoaD/ThiS family protein [Candidatus Poseidonia alphae]|uniref:MoaD/ThiS family protein n=1 Tax=Candidatus Poseidonia alphae TaxID=1915863 RepID=UPI002320BDE3|nr:MoaD/ThiS family protein [Candidatus Poseidonia alphae]MDA8638818.1 MoaD/ThiS family protein [Candidatus Poseidonia alphae]MDA8759268.1 MoaD/ThiS family protein [Candidatus Poseidonia alphae]